MKEPLRIHARMSHLARIQAIEVGTQLQRAHPHLQVQYEFRESLGDQKQSDPLWRMPEKGVFTEDFVKDLRTARCDLVVHSWKDLPLLSHAETEIVATLPRADARDLLLFRKDHAHRLTEPNASIEILSSSPRRGHNLPPFLSRALPGKPARIDFLPVRGNVPTRVQKLLAHPSAAGLIVAKAALDRLLSASQGEWSPMQTRLRDQLSRCRFMVLPLSQNPTAAAQGALAVEILRTRGDLRALLSSINCAATFNAVLREREILGAYGGGCHQKIGVSVTPQAYGNVYSLRGHTDAGEDLFKHQLLPERVTENPAPGSEPGILSTAWPLKPEANAWFLREPLAVKPVSPPMDWWVARAPALPAEWPVSTDQIVWTAGVTTWFKLAARGVWVNGTSDSLGERTPAGLEILLDRVPRWLKLTHAGAPPAAQMDTLATYKLNPVGTPPDLHGKAHFYWMSGSAFFRAFQLYPHEILGGQHASGPGRTFEALAQFCAERRIRTPQIYLDHSEWLKTFG